jgi:GNAT superfamily N-acetyltransferase
MQTELRPAVEADLDAMYGVFRAAMGDLFGRHGFAPPDPGLEAFRSLRQHLLDHDAERCWVADAGGSVVAFSAALVREDTWFLASLFVLPESQGRGLGPALLDRVWGSGYGRRLTMTDAIQPVSNGLYARRGLIPATPVLTLAGRPQRTSPAIVEPGAADTAAVARLDRAAYGFDRAADHGYWRSHARQTLWLEMGEPVAYSYRWPGGRIGPVAGLDGRRAAAALRAELAASDWDEAVVLVPGSSGALVTAALEAGLRIVGPPGLLLISDGSPPPEGLAVSSFTLL